MKHWIVFSVYVILTLVACRQPETLSQQEIVFIEKEVKSMLDAYCSDIKQSGLTAEFNYLDSSSDFFWVPPGYSSVLSYDSIATLIRINAGKFTRVDNGFESLTVNPLNANLAAYSGKLRSTMTDTSGHTFSMRLMETGIAIKKDMKWKLLCGQTNVLTTNN